MRQKGDKKNNDKVHNVGEIWNFPRGKSLDNWFSLEENPAENPFPKNLPLDPFTACPEDVESLVSTIISKVSAHTSVTFQPQR
jgi:hypothetical protein